MHRLTPTPRLTAVAEPLAPPRDSDVAGQRWWEAPEQYLLDAGREGELIIAKVRVALTAVLIGIPLINLTLAAPQERTHHVIGLAVNGTAFALACGVLWLVKRDRRQPWLPMATSLFDVTLITLAQVIFALQTDPQTVVNSKVTFETYFIALGGTCLRYDKRVALGAGVVAMVQFLATIVWVTHSFPIDTVGLTSVYGRFQWADQYSRLVLLGCATALNVFIVDGIQKQRRLSNADALTGVFNRRFFDDYLQREVARATRAERPLAVAMVDVDLFKQFNDRFGHGPGDQALQRVARTLQLAVRRSDLVARYGGEEFVVILHDSTAQQAMERLEQLRQAVSRKDVLPDRPEPTRVTVSIGVADRPHDGETALEILAEADRRLFAAKEAGRNRVVGPGHAVRGANA